MLPDKEEVQDISVQHWTGHSFSRTIPGILQPRLRLSAQFPLPQKGLPLLTFARVLKICHIQKPLYPKSIIKTVQGLKKLVPLLPILITHDKSLSGELHGQKAKKQTLVDPYFSALSV